MGIFICHDQILLSSDEEINLSKPNDFKSLIDPDDDHKFVLISILYRIKIIMFNSKIG